MYLLHSRSQRPLSFSSAPRIATSGQVQHPEVRDSRTTGSLQFTDFPSLCACSESSLTTLIGSGFNLLCLQSHSKPECHWTGPEVAILAADQKERGLWGRECTCYCNVRANCFCASLLCKQIHMSRHASSARARC